MMEEKTESIIYLVYKESVRDLAKLCDLVEIFTCINTELIQKQQCKIKKKHMSNLFVQVTDTLLEMKQILKTLKIQPFNGTQRYFWDYYYNLNDYERMGYDNKSI